MNASQSPFHLPALKDVFESYSGPVLALDGDAALRPLNDAGGPIADLLNGDEGVTILPALVQLAVKARTEGRAKTRTFGLPTGGCQIEFMLLPQIDGTLILIGRDATLEVNIRTALAESRSRFKDLVDVAADFAWETDREGLICYISPRGALGYSPEELLGERPETLLLAPDTAPKPLPFHADRAVRNIELWLRTRAGDSACVMISATPVLSKTGTRNGSRGIAIDVSEERERQVELARLKTRERLVSYIVEALRSEVTAPEMLHSAASALGRSCSADACLVEVLHENGQPLESAVFGRAPDPALSDDALAKIRLRIGAAEGTLGRERYLGTATGFRGTINGSILLWRQDGSPEFSEEERQLLTAVEPQFGVVFRQISDQYTLEHLSRTDELTALSNRRAFMEDLTREMMRYERYGNTGALLFVDLDNFKPINDEHGHEKGDETLRAIGTILAGSIRTYDLVCRLGGDEFAVWLESADRDIAHARAEDFLSKLDQWRKENIPGTIKLGMSIGIAMFHPGTHQTVENLIARADAAMYEAKKAGKNRIAFEAD